MTANTMIPPTMSFSRWLILALRTKGIGSMHIMISPPAEMMICYESSQSLKSSCSRSNIQYIQSHKWLEPNCLSIFCCQRISEAIDPHQVFHIGKSLCWSRWSWRGVSRPRLRISTTVVSFLWWGEEKRTPERISKTPCSIYTWIRWPKVDWSLWKCCGRIGQCAHTQLHDHLWHHNRILCSRPRSI